MAEQHASIGSELESVQSRIQASLDDLLQPVDVRTVSVRSVAARPDSTLAIEVDARCPQPIRVEEWRLVATAVSRELNLPLQLSGNLAIGDPILLRFHQKSLRLNSRDRRILAQFLSRWDKQSDVVYWLVLGKSADAKVSASRVQLLKKRSAKMELAAMAVEEPPDGDTIILSAAQQVNAQVEKGNSGSPAAPAPAKQ